MHVRVCAYLNVYTHIHLSICAHLCACACMMMIAFMTMNSGLVPLIEGPCAQILYLRSEIIGGMRSHICGGDCPPWPKHEYAAKVCTVSKAVMGTAHLIWDQFHITYMCIQISICIDSWIKQWMPQWLYMCAYKRVFAYTYLCTYIHLHTWRIRRVFVAE